MSKRIKHYSHDNVLELNSNAITTLFTVVRNKDTPKDVFVKHFNRLLRILAEEGLASLASKTTIVTPTNATYEGLKPVKDENICAISIMRSGDILLERVLEICPGASVGKILIQRDEASEEKLPKLYYSKLPKDIGNKKCLLCDPMLATGGSVIEAIEVLKKVGVKVENILFLNLISCPEGLDRVTKKYPELKIVTAAVDDELNSDKYM